MSSLPVLNYKSFGSGPPVMVMHGLFGMLDNWQTFAKALSDHYTVFIVDLRNHGRSFHDDDTSYPAMAGDVITLADHLGLKRFNLIGHSMGGKVACQIALDHPERVDHLIAVDILPTAYGRGHDMVLKALADLRPEKVGSRKEAENKLVDLLGGDMSTALFLLKSLKRGDDGGYAWRFNLAALSEGYEDIRNGVEGEAFDRPALFVKGGDSEYITVDRWMEIHDIFPLAEMEEVPDAGHWVHVDQPEKLLEVVKEFLGREVT
jgi:pimeloyl-ACP methyl ester carboxylesterase